MHFVLFFIIILRVFVIYFMIIIFYFCNEIDEKVISWIVIKFLGILTAHLIF